MSVGGGVRRIEVTEREGPVFGGAEFGSVGPYERLHGRVFGELDPTHRLNAGIVNLARAARNAHGNVEYQSDFRILKPIDLNRGCGCLVYDVPNRGNQPIMPRLNGAPDCGHPDHAGNGFLMRRGFTLVWSGWQGDVPAGADRLTARFPIIPGITGIVREEFIAEATGLLGDSNIRELSEERFVGTLVYPAADPAGATLTVREREADPRGTPPGLAWRFVDDRHVEITRPTAPGFDRGAIYEFIYGAREPIVMGIGFAAIRDIVSFLRYTAKDNPLAPQERPAVRHALGLASHRAAACFATLCILGSTRISRDARYLTASYRSWPGRAAPASIGSLRRPVAIRASTRTTPTVMRPAPRPAWRCRHRSGRSRSAKLRVCQKSLSVSRCSTFGHTPASRARCRMPPLRPLIGSVKVG
jgi:hypothetical protein